MNDAMLKGAIRSGAARYRRLSGCHVLLTIPDMKFTQVIMEASPAARLDLTGASRLSKSEANKAINLLDAPQPFKEFYRSLLNGKGGQDNGIL